MGQTRLFQLNTLQYIWLWLGVPSSLLLLLRVADQIAEKARAKGFRTKTAITVVELFVVVMSVLYVVYVLTLDLGTHSHG